MAGTGMGYGVDYTKPTTGKAPVNREALKQWLNPVPFVKGIGEQIAGTHLDQARLAGKAVGLDMIPKSWPSSSRNLIATGKALKDDPAGTVGNMAFGPGGLYNLASLAAPVPKGAGFARNIPKNPLVDKMVVGANKLVGREPYYHGMRHQWDGYQPSLHGLREKRPVMQMEVETPGGAPGLPSYFRSYGNEFNTRGLFTTRDLPLARHYAGHAEKWVPNAKGGHALMPTKTGSVIRTFDNPKNYAKFEDPRAITPHAQQIAAQNLTRPQYKQAMQGRKGIKFDDFEGAGTYPTGKNYSGPTRKNTHIEHPYAETTIMTKDLKKHKWAEVDPVTGLRK